jgi:hypothetical protein
MVRRSERKMQPRGFFRPKFKSAAKKVVAKATRPAAAIVKVASGEQKPITAPPQGAAKVAALPAGSVVRHRQKPDPKSLANGSSKPPGAPGVPLKKPADALRDAVTAGGPASPSVVMPALPPELLQSMERGSATAQQALRPAVNGHAAPPPQLRVPDQTAEAQRQSIVTPLSDALARATSSDPTTGRPAAPRAPANGMSPVPPTEPSPRLNGTPPPPPVSAPPAPPDFSTLPPSIAASLARLAGNTPAKGEKAAGDAPRTEQKIASKG